MNNVLLSCHVNAQSLLCHYDQFLQYFLDNFYHLIAVSETWLKPHIPSSQVSIPHYNFFRHDRTDRTGGGVGLFVHDSLRAKILSQSPPSSLPHTEFIFVEVSIPQSPLLFGVIYRPPRIPFDQSLESCLFQLVPSFPNTILAGDFNTNLMIDSPDKAYLTHLFTSLSLAIVPSNPTHHTLSSDTLLDLFVTDSLDKILSSSQHPVPFLSAHDLIHITYDIPVPVFRPKLISYRNLDSLSHESLKTYSETLPLDPILNSGSIDFMSNSLTSSLHYILNTLAPLKSRVILRPPAPWLTPAIKSLMKSRDAARRRFRRTRYPEDYTSYKRLRNLTQSSIKLAKSRYFQQALSSAPDCKSKWKILRNLSLIKSKDRPSLFPSPDVLNSHFVFTAPSDSSSNVNYFHTDFDPDRFFFSYISPDELLTSVLRSRTNDLGPDDIPVKLIHGLLPDLLPILLHIYNFSLQNSVFPSSWKKALVRPLNKASNPSSPNDFRPISLLSNLSKPLERLVQSQISSFLEERKLLNPLQSGFRPGFSTQSALLKITHDLQAAIDSQKLTILILLDFSKAFDTVDHNILLSKLRNLSFSNSVIQWFQSYLSGRSQFVVIPDHPPSKPLPLARGVPQGSSLSPILFSIYINDLPNSILHSNYHLYADDSQIYLSFHPSDLTSAVAKLQEDLCSISSWADKNKLCLNAQKTKAILIGSYRLLKTIPSIPTLSLNGSPIQFCPTVKNLGIVFDQSLSWKSHVSQISRRSISILKQLYTSRHLLPFHTRQLLVSSLIFPHFDYGCAVYGGLTGELDACLKRLMNCFIRFIFGVPRDSRISRYYAELQWLFPRYRRQYLLASFLYQTIHTQKPAYIFTLLQFKSDIHARNTRSRPSDLYTPSHRTAAFDKSFIIRTASLWNSIPTHIRNSPSLPTFKSKYYSHLLSLQAE